MGWSDPTEQTVVRFGQNWESSPLGIAFMICGISVKAVYFVKKSVRKKADKETKRHEMNKGCKETQRESLSRLVYLC